MRRSVAIIAGILFLIPTVAIAYRGLVLGESVLPVVLGRIWRITIEGQITPQQKEIYLEMAVPSTYANRRVIEERVERGNLNVSLSSEGPNRFALWSGTLGGSEETISYSASVLVRRRRDKEQSLPADTSYPLDASTPEYSLVQRIGSILLKVPAAKRLQAIGRTAVGTDLPFLSQSDAEEWKVFRQKHGTLLATVTLFQTAGFSVRPVEGLRLADGTVDRLVRWVEVWDGTRWESISIDSGDAYGKPWELLPLVIGGYPPVLVSGAGSAQFRWTATRRMQDYWRLHYAHIRASSHFLDRWSLFHLPDESQQVLRILILVPVGALLICVLRNIVGFPTFGIFMPVLMALAFRSTGLMLGLAIFAAIIGSGYFLRSRLDRLRLLLVPRLSMILTFVIGCLILAAMLGHRYSLPQLMAVGLLPMVILTMAIERFFIILEEAGLAEGLRTAAGTAAVATITYLVLHWELLQITFFLYPELLFGVAGLQLLIGRYTGFRLLELFRFGALGRQS